MSELTGSFIELFVSQISAGIRDSNGIRNQASLSGELFMNPDLGLRLSFAMAGRHHGGFIFRRGKKTERIVTALGICGHINQDAVVVLGIGSQLLRTDFGLIACKKEHNFVSECLDGKVGQQSDIRFLIVIMIEQLEILVLIKAVINMKMSEVKPNLRYLVAIEQILDLHHRIATERNGFHFKGKSLAHKLTPVSAG